MNLKGKIILLFAISILIAAGLAWKPQAVAATPQAPVVAAPAPVVGSPRQMLLARHEGAGLLDGQIRQTQAMVARFPENPAHLSQLGRQFITKARVSFDPGYYKLAELCAAEMEKMPAGKKSGLLLRGHCLLALHRFAEGEKIARELTKEGEGAGDLEFALLGDALMEQGKLEEALPAYQSMIDARPCLPTYSRAAHLRWLRGDVDGAASLMGEAISCGSHRDKEPLAWVTTRLGAYELQRGNDDAALALASRAVEMLPNYAPALLLQGKIQWHRQQFAEAAATLQQAAMQNPLPEYQWALADAQRQAGMAGEAEKTEGELMKTGAQRDPRTFSLWLSTRRSQETEALRLANEELAARHDGFTWDTVAWAQFAGGQLKEAEASMAKALAPGTKDARLFLHAGLIAQALGKAVEAQKWLGQAQALRQMLLPSETKLLAGAPGPAATPLSPASLTAKPSQGGDDQQKPAVLSN